MVSAKDHGEVIINDIITPVIEQAKIMQNKGTSEVQDFDDDTSRFRAGTLDNALAKDVNDHLRMRPSDPIRIQRSNWATENG